MLFEKLLLDFIIKCFVYNLNYVFNKCKVFCFKFFEVWKRFLKENRICFCCCVFILYISCDCKVFIKCEECGNDRYLIVFYLDFRLLEGILCFIWFLERDFLVKNFSFMILLFLYGGEESLMIEFYKLVVKILCI